MAKIAEHEYMSREEFFAQEPARFDVKPLDVSLAKAQYDLIPKVRNQTDDDKSSFDTSFTLNSPRLSLSRVSIKCFQITGSSELYDVVMRVDDKEHENFAYGWITMGTFNDIEKALNSNTFVPTCKRWAKWLDYARKNYPTKDGMLYYWTEWQPIKAETQIFKGDPDLYGISSKHAHELKCILRQYFDHLKPGEQLFQRDMVMNCSYPCAPGDEDKFSSMRLQLHCFTTGRIDLVGEIVYNENFTYIHTRIIIHSFESIEKCLCWLDRGGDTADDCHLRMGELLMCE